MLMSQSRRRYRSHPVVWCAVFAFALLIAGQVVSAQTDAMKQAYRDISKGVQSKNLASTVQTLAGYGSRVAGYPGDAKAADYVEQQFRALGLENIAIDQFNTTVPFDPSVEDPAKGATAEIQGKSGAASKLKIYPLWPNLVRTSTLPKDGLTAPAIYVRDGKLRHFNGKDVDGSIVIVDFNCAAEWMNAPRLGAKAVIFVAPDSTMRGEAEAKFISIPISIPRFYITKSEAAPLLAECVSGRAPKLKLTCEMPWLTRPVRNITGWIQGTDPVMRDQIIVVQAYYDSISVVPALAPGADTACGIAALSLIHI